MSADLTPLLQTAKDFLKDAGLKGMSVQDIAEDAIAQNKNMGLSVEELCKAGKL